MSLTWYSRSEKQQLPGNYGEPIAKPITDTAVEIVPEGNHRYLTISNEGPGNIYVRIGGNATLSDYNFILPKGYNEWGKRISGQQITGVCNTGETATLMVALAPEIAI